MSNAVYPDGMATGAGENVTPGICFSRGLVWAPERIEKMPVNLRAGSVANRQAVFHPGFKMTGNIAGENDAVLAHKCPGKPG